MTDEKKDGAMVPRPPDGMTKPDAGGGRLATRPASAGAKAASVLFGACLVGTVVAGFRTPGSGTVVAAGVGAFLLAMFFTRLDLFDAIEGAGFKLRMRRATEEAEQATARAQAAADDAHRVALEAATAAAAATAATAAADARLTNLSEMVDLLRPVTLDLSGLLLNALATQGRFGSALSKRERLAVAVDRMSALQRLGFLDADVLRATELLRNSVTWDIGNAALNAAGNAFARRNPDAAAQEAFDAQVHGLRLPGLPRFELPSPTEMRAFFATHDLAGESSVEAKLAEYEAFLATGALPPEDEDE